MEMYTGRAGTALGPLTTTWSSMPASCTVHMICSTCNHGFQGQKCFVSNGVQITTDNSACWPPATPGAGIPQTPLYGWGYYSPGLACPSGYTTACTAQYGGRYEWDIQFNLVAGETAIGCCPEGFRCANSRGNTCMAVAATGTQIVVATGKCSGAVVVSSQATFPDVVMTVTITPDPVDIADGSNPRPVMREVTPTREVTLLAPMFQLNFKASDLSVSSTTSAASSISTSDSTPNSPPASTSVSLSSAANGQGGLSPGAAAGLGVGATIGAMLLAAAGGWLWKKKRRQRASAVELEAVGMAHGSGMREKQPPSNYLQSPPSELNATYALPELYNDTRAEMPGITPPGPMSGPFMDRPRQT